MNIDIGIGIDTDININVDVDTDMNTDIDINMRTPIVGGTSQSVHMRKHQPTPMQKTCIIAIHHPYLVAHRRHTCPDMCQRRVSTESTN